MSLPPLPSYLAPDTLSDDKPEWQVIHDDLVALSLARSAQDHAIGVALLAAQAAGVPSLLGYGSLFEYAHRLFGFEPRQVEDRLRVAERLRDLPAMDAALREGALCWSAVRELSRVASPETEREWLSAAEGKAVRQIEKMTSGRGPGDCPDDKPKRELRRRVLRLELSGEAMALWRDAVGKIRRDAGGGIDDEQALMLMARQVLGGPTEEGRASYQISITLCERCEQGYQRGRGEELPVHDEVVEMARCDAQELGRVGLPPEEGDGETHVDAPSLAAERVDESECDVGGTHVGGARPNETHVGESRSSETHVGESRSSKTHVGESRSPETHVGESETKRVSQTIPPRIKRLVLERSRGRCEVDGCCNSVFLDLHHSRTRAEGGDHDPELLVCLCGAHHRQVHAGRLLIEGTASGGFRFYHADGSRYGSPAVSPRAQQTVALVFQALRHMRVPEAQARRAVQAARSKLGDRAPLEALLRAALAELAPS